MNISSSWLAEYVSIGSDLKSLCEKLTMAGIEVEAVESNQKVPSGIVAAKILERTAHPSSDHLSVCRVFDGEKEVQIVCGAPNCDAGKIVPLATIGTVFKSEEGEFVIKKSKLRGVESFGMMCSGKELGVSEDDSGLLILPDTVAPGTSLQELYPGDNFIEVEVTPNRPDWLSHWGIARDVACLLDTPAKLPEISVLCSGDAPANLVTVEAADLCPRYIGRVIRNVKVGPSPEWLKQRLESVGLRSINNIVDITNFVLMELGHPLHAFDCDLLQENRVVVRRARDGEKIVTLNGAELKLDSANLVIADAEKPMALAGVMGGEFSGVTEKTVNILLESAVFNRSNIRATSRALGISSDSSYRYERGVDYDMADIASDRAAQLIVALAGGVAGRKLDVNGGRPEEKEIVCRFDRIRSLIGVDVSNERMLDIFRKLHLTVNEADAEKCVVTAPLFRLDLEREADLAEEVARINGLDAVPIVPVTGKMVGVFADDALAPIEKLRNELIGFGLFECLHYSMVNEKSAFADTRFGKDDVITLKNPLSLELAYMRPSLFGEMLDSAERNIARRNLDFRLFEVSRAFCANPKLYKEERLECCIALSGRKHPERFSAEKKEHFDFYDLKGLLESLLEKRGVVNFAFVPAADGRFAADCCAALKINGKIAGHFGKLAAAYTKSWRTTNEVFFAVLDADMLLDVKSRSLYYQPFSLFPATRRDVAFVADASLTHAAVVEFIRRSGIKNLESVELFDIFTDEKTLGAGRRSMAYALTFRNAERTLTDNEVNAAFEKLRERLAAELKVELR